MNNQFLLEKGKYYWLRDLWTEAEEIFRRIINNDYFDSEAHYWLGTCLEKKEQFIDACEHFARSVELSEKCKKVGTDGEISKPEIERLVELVDSKVL